MGVASLVLGIISLACSIFLVGLNWVGAITGLIGIVLGAAGRKDEASRGIATGGLVCSIIGFIISVLAYVGCAICVGGLGSLVK